MSLYKAEVIPKEEEYACEYCPFWSRLNPATDIGECRYSAPICADKGGDAAWPTIHKSGWCGKHPQRRIVEEMKVRVWP